MVGNPTHMKLRTTGMMTLKSSNVIAAAVLSVGLTSIGAPDVGHAADRDPFALYGERILFDVYRNDKRVGTHEVLFKRDGETLVVDSDFNLSLRILGLFTYDYRYQSSESWANGTLIALDATIDDNGDETSVRVTKTNGMLKIAGPGAEEIAPLGIYPTTHWNAGVIGTTQVINTITGSVNNVILKDKGRMDVPTGDTVRSATHFAYQGDLSTEVWYDDDGRWVKMQFPGSDGTMIEYRCQICGNTQAADGSPNQSVSNGG